MKITPSVLEQVHWDNVRDQQIGETDGMTPEVARDIGYLPLHETVQTIELVELKPSPKPLTSKQQNENAKKYVAGHLKRVKKQVMDPNYG